MILPSPPPQEKCKEGRAWVWQGHGYLGSQWDSKEGNFSVRMTQGSLLFDKMEIERMTWAFLKQRPWPAELRWEDTGTFSPNICFRFARWKRMRGETREHRQLHLHSLTRLPIHPSIHPPTHTQTHWKDRKKYTIVRSIEATVFFFSVCFSLAVLPA